MPSETTVRVAGREIRIRELTTGFFNAFDSDCTRLVIAVQLSRGWWLGALIGGDRHDIHIPHLLDAEGEPIHPGAVEATRRLLTS
ncbi:hypothetical protein ACFY4C_27480 [Actinomadura viridis]|uniref:hypothetical protein n=1 Tax=Actinomadura viridis TaxID=58110 RepID=UPI0036C856C2